MEPIQNKLAPRYAISDWHTSNVLIRTNAERLRDSSHTVRQEARRLRNETDNHTRWTQHDTNTKINKRIDDINEWRSALQKCLTDIDAEIESLQLEKERTEKALEEKTVPLNVAIECLMLRENRQKIDLVRDDVEEQLHKEVEVIEGIKAVLQQKISEAFEQICILQEARHQLHCDLSDKDIAVDIDGTCAKLNNLSTDIDFQRDPTRTIKGIVTPETWDSYSQYNKLRAEAEMKASQRLREAIFAALEKAKNDLDAQCRATEYAFRKRIHETEQAKGELEWQQKNTKEEIETLEGDIAALKEAIDAKIAPMKVAQTRLEKRTFRPNVELCRDIPQYQLCYEVGEIEGTVKSLTEKLIVAENALENLLRDLARIEEDLAVKTNSLMLDNKSMTTREQLRDIPQDSKEADAGIKSLEPADVASQRQSPLQDKLILSSRQGTHDQSYRLPASNIIDWQKYEKGKLSEMQKDFAQTTYSATYNGSTNIRSGDLARTLNQKQKVALVN